MYLPIHVSMLPCFTFSILLFHAVFYYHDKFSTQAIVMRRNLIKALDHFLFIEDKVFYKVNN